MAPVESLLTNLRTSKYLIWNTIQTICPSLLFTSREQKHVLSKPSALAHSRQSPLPVFASLSPWPEPDVELRAAVDPPAAPAAAQHYRLRLHERLAVDLGAGRAEDGEVAQNLHGGREREEESM